MTIKRKFFSLLCMVAFLTGGIASASNTHKSPDIKNVQQAKSTAIFINDELGPIVGAAVGIKGTSTGSISDIDGKCVLNNVPQGAVLVISYLGYITQEITYNGQATLHVTLLEDSQALGEVVVTALGIKKERRALPYALSEVKADDLRMVPTQGLGSSLYGKVAGMQVSSTAGGQMGGTKIQLRGINSMAGSNRPLIVVDGIPVYDDDTKYSGRDRDGTQETSALNDINPDDIESMSVLKGANAAALYGSRATNGVIVITTKKGTAKQGLGIELSSSYTHNQMVWMPEYQNEFGVGTQHFFNTNSAGQNILQNSSVSWGPKLDGTKVLWWDGVERPFVAQKDNMKDLFQNGFNNNNSISITSGGEKSSMRVSYANNNYKGFLNNMKQTRHNFNFSGTTQLASWLSVNASMSYNHNKNENPGTRIDRISNYPLPRNEITALYKQHYKTADGYFMTDEMRNGAQGAGNGINSNLQNNIVNYLMWEQNENKYVTSRDRYLGNLSTSIKLIDPLSVRLSIGTDRIYTLKEDKEMHKQYSDPADAASLQGMYRKVSKTYIKNFYEAMVMYDQQLGEKFHVSVMGAFSSEDIKESSSKWQSNGLKINGMFSSVNNKGGYSQGSANNWVENESELMYAVYGSGQLAYSNYLYLDITARNDWSSRLPSYSRSFFYPSFGLGFVFSDAFKVPEWLTYGKLRASYAIVGNYTPSRYFANILYTQSSFDDRVTTNSFSTTIPPVSIEPEKTHSWEFGTELKFFGGRMGADLTYFSNETRNQILSATIPVSTGGGKMSVNAGKVQSKGVELQLTGRPVETKDFTWSSTLNLSRTKSTLKELADGLEYYQTGGGWNAQFRALPGDPVYGVYIRKWKRDDAGNKIVGSNGRYIQDTEYSYMGDAMPKVVAGFSNTFRYKNLSLNVMIDGQFGGKLVSFTNSLLKATGVGKESLFGRDEAHGGLPYYVDGNNNKILLDSHTSAAPDGSRVFHDGVIAKGVKEDGTPNDVLLSAYHYHYYTYNGPLDASEDLVRNNTYVKVRELNLTYNMPEFIYSKLKLQGLSLSLIGGNLFYIYKSIPNVSPESALGTSGAEAYIEYTSYPSERNFGFSVKARF